MKTTEKVAEESCGICSKALAVSNQMVEQIYYRKHTVYKLRQILLRCHQNEVIPIQMEIFLS